MMKSITVVVAMLAFSSVMAASAADAKTNWDKMCAKCHGADGKGQTKMGKKLHIKDLTDVKVQSELRDQDAFTAAKEGLKDKNGRTLMKPAEGISDDEIKALVQYVRGFRK